MSAGRSTARSRRVHDDVASHRPWLAAALVAGVAVGLAVALVGVPREHARLPTIAREALTIALPHWHITEPVNEVVYGSRGFDTFGETFLLLAAVVSVLVLTRRREHGSAAAGEEEAGQREQAQIDPQRSTADRWERLARVAEQGEQALGRVPATADREPLGAPGPEEAREMTIIVRTAGRIAAPALAIFGVYLAAWGYSPGGGFPAGVVLVGVVLLLYAGFGYQRIEHLVRQSRVELVELAGGAAIIAIVTLGLILKGSATANFLPLARDPTTILSGGVLQAFSASELIEVASGLSLAIFALIAMRHDWAETDGDTGT